MKGKTAEGRNISMVMQVANVRKVLGSVGKFTDAGNRVVFDDDSPEGSYILNKASGRRTKIELKNGNYIFRMWVPKSPFQGPA